MISFLLGIFQKESGLMKNIRLPSKVILSTALLLILMGSLSSTMYSNFQEFISVSHGKVAAVPLEMIEGNKLAGDLSQTSPSWRRKLSKHIFINIDQELQALEQQLILHKSAKGKQLIKKVKVSLQRMISGKQKFISTGQEPSLLSFYRGRTILEYRLWQLKGLTQDLQMDRTQAHGVHRVYALMNKWLIYVAHREISARRKGTLDTSLQAEAEPTGEQDTEASNTAFTQISEVARMTEQDFEKADEALSRQPAPVTEEQAPSIEPQTLEPLIPETDEVTTPNVIIEEDTLSPQTFEKETRASSQSPQDETAAEPNIGPEATPEFQEPQTQQNSEPNLVRDEDTASSQSFEEGIDSSDASPIPNCEDLIASANKK